MAWRIEFEQAAAKELGKLDRQVAQRIVAFLRERIAILDDPRSIGQALHGERFGEFWKYRIGDYRVIARIEDQQVRILVVRISHRSQAYR
ncbi:MAG: type II toxin-antitoxin system RelE family toxin [Burkholderiaceae bacterium]